MTYILVISLLSLCLPHNNVSTVRVGIFVCLLPDERSLLTLGREVWWTLKKYFLSNE